MIEESQFKQLARLALRQAKSKGAIHTEVVISHGTEELTRFANNMIHQSVSLTDSLVHIRVALGKKIGVARTNRLDREGVLRALHQALDLAKLQKEDPHFVGLPAKSRYPVTKTQYELEKHIGSVGRAKSIARIISRAKHAQLVASGAFSESDGATAVANSNDVWAYQKGKSASLTTIVMGQKGSGFGSHSTRGGAHIDVEKIARTAVFKATHGEFVDLPPGEYEVVLEPPAVAELLDFFSWLGPNARIYHEDVSFYQGNLGKQVFHPLLTIHDDPLNSQGYPIGFDYEGHPKKKHTLVEKGKLTKVLYDSYHAAKYRQENTGHALLAPNTFGPIPTHMVIEPGEHTAEAMVKNVRRGLLVTRFWYTRVIQHKQLMLTGMTRDGTFFIENGKIVGRVRNLRYTESVVEAFKKVKGVGKLLELHGSEGSPSLVPALHLGSFRFTGVTKHG